jgi:hypothetical protein
MSAIGSHLNRSAHGTKALHCGRPKPGCFASRDLARFPEKQFYRFQETSTPLAPDIVMTGTVWCAEQGLEIRGEKNQ